jgi:hypothetical protein
MFSLLFSVSNFYFTSQYHQFPLSYAAAAPAAATTTVAAAAAAVLKFHRKHEKRKQKP